MLIQNSILHSLSPALVTYQSNKPRFNHVSIIQQRIHEKQKELYVVDSQCAIVYQIAHDTLEGSSSIQLPQSRMTQAYLTQKLQMIKQRIQIRQKQLKDVEQNHQTNLQMAGDAFTQVDKEIQHVKCIEQEQQDIQQDLSIVGQDLQATHEKATLLKQKQEDLSQKIEEKQHTLDEVLSKEVLLFPKKVLSNITQIKSNHEKIEQGFEKLQAQAQKIQKDQSRLHLKFNILNQTHSSLLDDLVKEILNAKTLYSQKMHMTWEEIKTQTRSLSSYLWTNVTFIASQTPSWIAWAALKAYQFPKKAASNLMQWGWSYVAGDVSPITWMAIGIFALGVAKSLVANYPLISLGVFTCLISSYIVYMKCDNFKSMIGLASG